MVWKQGAPAWGPAEKVPELAALFPELPPPIPPEERFKRYLTGRWEAVSVDQFGVTTELSVEYRQDGNYSGLVTATYQGFSSPAPISGSWTVQAVGEERFALTMRPGGGGIGLPQTASTVVIRVIDDNTAFNETEGYEASRVQ
jgi:hypothetical protein